MIRLAEASGNPFVRKITRTPHPPKKKERKKERNSQTKKDRANYQYICLFFVFSHHTDYVLVHEKHDGKTVQILTWSLVLHNFLKEQSNTKLPVTYMIRVTHRNQKHKANLVSNNNPLSVFTRCELSQQLGDAA